MGRGLSFERDERPSFIGALKHLFGHVLGGATLFLVIALVAWLVGYAIHMMNEAHAFPSTILNILGGAEYVLLALDFALSFYVLALGACRFVKDLWG